MNRIDFRSEYTAVAVISFALTFFAFLALLEAASLGTGVSAFFTKFFLSIKSIWLFLRGF